MATYFEVIHPSYPLLDPSRFIKGNKIDLPLLASMYQVALPFCAATRGMSPGDIKAFLFQALPVEARSPRLETIEAALLIQQRHTTIQRTPSPPGIYPELGLTVGMCHDAGLNVDPTKWCLSEADKKRRKRLWWAVYINDTWAALNLGRPSYIHDDDCNVPLLTQDDVAPRTVSGGLLPTTSSRVFVAMTALSRILSTLLSTFYTLRAASYIEQLSEDDLLRWKDYFEGLFATFYAEHVMPLAPVQGVLLDPAGKSSRIPLERPN